MHDIKIVCTFYGALQMLLYKGEYSADLQLAVIKIICSVIKFTRLLCRTQYVKNGKERFSFN